LDIFITDEYENGNKLAPTTETGNSAYYLGDTVTMEFGEIIFTMINVGSGDCFYIILPDDRTMLVDGGTSFSNENEVQNYTYTNTVKLIENKRIDYLVVTHTDYDHYQFIYTKTFFNAFEVIEAFVPWVKTSETDYWDSPFLADNSSFNTFIKNLVVECGIDNIYPVAG